MAVKRAAAVRAKPDANGLTRSASIDKTTITVEAKDSKGAVTMKVTLVHPSVAPDGAFTAAGVSLIEAPGPIEPKALAALKASLSKAKKAVANNCFECAVHPLTKASSALSIF